MNKLRVLIVGMLTMTLLAVALPAKACSCFRGDPYEAYQNADGAFVGQFVSSHDPDPPEPGGVYSSGDPIIYTFQLEEGFKGEFGETVDVVSARDGASCGLEVQPGESYGLLLFKMESGEWSSGLCSQMSPEDLREAARGLPAPTGEGPIKLLVGGSFGPATTIALDEQGRTLSYGYGEGDVTDQSVCPGSERFAEIAVEPEKRPRLVLRETATMDVLADTELPLSSGYRGQQPRGLLCRNSDGSGTIVVSLNGNRKRPRGIIWSVTDGVATKLFAGAARNAEIAGDRVHMREKKGRTLSYFDLKTESRVRMASVTRKAGLAVSPDGNRVAGISGNPTSVLTLADLSGSKPRIHQAALGSYVWGDLLWIDDRTLALMPGGSENTRIRLFDDELNGIKSVPGDWYTVESVLTGDRAWGVGWGGLYRAELTEGPAELVRRLPTEVTYSITPVMDEVHPTGE